MSERAENRRSCDLARVPDMSGWKGWTRGDATGEGTVQLSTPYGTDAPGMIYERFPGGVGFVGSYEHEVVLEVARSLEVRVGGA